MLSHRRSRRSLSLSLVIASGGLLHAGCDGPSESGNPTAPGEQATLGNIGVEGMKRALAFYTHPDRKGPVFTTAPDGTRVEVNIEAHIARLRAWIAGEPTPEIERVWMVDGEVIAAFGSGPQYIEIERQVISALQDCDAFWELGTRIKLHEGDTIGIMAGVQGELTYNEFQGGGPQYDRTPGYPETWVEDWGGLAHAYYSDHFTPQTYPENGADATLDTDHKWETTEDSGDTQGELPSDYAHICDGEGGGHLLGGGPSDP